MMNLTQATSLSRLEKKKKIAHIWVWNNKISQLPFYFCVGKKPYFNWKNTKNTWQSCLRHLSNRISAIPCTIFSYSRLFHHKAFLINALSISYIFIVITPLYPPYTPLDKDLCDLWVSTLASELINHEIKISCFVCKISSTLVDKIQLSYYLLTF